MSRPAINIVWLPMALVLPVSWAFGTSDYVFWSEPVTLSDDKVVLQPQTPVDRNLLNAALCLELDADWSVASERSIRLGNERAITINVTCITSDDKRYDAPSFYSSSSRGKHQLCGKFNKIPLGAQVTRCEVRVGEPMTMRQAVWHEHSAK